MSTAYTLQLHGDCGIKRIRACRDEIAAALKTTKSLEIDCVGVEQIDFAFVQLIASAALTARRNSQQIRLTGLAEELRPAFSRAGLPLPASHEFLSWS